MQAVDTERFRLEAVTVCILSKKDSHSAAGMCTALCWIVTSDSSEELEMKADIYSGDR